MNHTKLLIIGAGPGGYETAAEAAKRGLSVTIVESAEVGGTCLNEGCIPTKAFCRHAQILDDLHRADEFGISVESVAFDLRRAVERKNEVVAQLRSGVESLLAKTCLVRGTARFVDSHTVEVNDEQYSADYIMVATGSVSQSLPIPGTDLEGVVTSREILDLEQVPRRLCVIGAGVIGLEFASIFAAFGSEVSVVEYAREILPRFDSDLAKRLRQALGKRGIDIQTQAAVSSISRSDDGLLTVNYSRKGKEEAVEADLVLMAVGRRANVASLNLADAGIEFTPRGIPVDDRMRTNVPHIYAIGDVNGRQMLAHAASFQGLHALNDIMGVEDHIRLDIMPSAVFTMPEAATVGLTEDECKQQGLPYTCKKSFFRANGKAVSMGETEGLCKLIVGDGGRLLGCHLFGAHAADLVQEVCALMSTGATIDDFRDIIHTHPTLGEVIQMSVHS